MVMRTLAILTAVLFGGVIFDASAQTQYMQQTYQPQQQYPQQAPYPQQPYYPAQYQPQQYPSQQQYMPQPYVPQPAVRQPSYPVRRNPFGGGIGGVSMGNKPLPVQKMSAQPVYLPPPVYQAPAARTAAEAETEAEPQDTEQQKKQDEPEQKGLKMFRDEDAEKALNPKRRRLGNSRYENLSDRRKEELLEQVILDKDREERRKRFKLKKAGDR